MKKWAHFVIIIVVVSGSAARAQGAFKGSVTMGLDTAFPIGEFASTDIKKAESGFAQIGFGFDIGYVLMHSSGKFGLTGTLRYISFGFDIDAIVNGRDPNIANWYGEADNWKTTSILVGGVYNIVNKESFTLGPRLQLGWMILSSQSSYWSGAGSKSSYIRGDTFLDATGSFSYQAGLLMGVRTSPRVRFVASADYMGASPTPSFRTSLTSVLGPIVSKSGTYSQPVAAVIINVGFVFEL